MRLTLRIAILVGAMLAAVLAGRGLYKIDRRLRTSDQEARLDQELLAEALRPVLARTVRTEGTAAARYLVATLDAHQPGRRLRWVALGASSASDAPALIETSTAAITEGRTRSLVLEQPSTRWIYTYVPVEAVGAEPSGLLEIRRRLPTRAELTAQMAESQAVASVSLLLAALLSVVVLGGWLVGRPVSRLVAHARAVGMGDLAARLPTGRRDELGELAVEMNTMTERLAALRQQAEDEASGKLDALRQLRHADRLAAVGQLSAGVAHEVSTPLNVIVWHAEMIQEAQELDAAHASASKILTQAERITKIVRGLMRFAGDREACVERIELEAVAREACDLLEVAAREADVTLEIEPNGSCVAEADAGQIHQVLTNLIVNAIHASRAGGVIRVGCRDDGDTVALTVDDEGSGIPEELVDTIFDPFVTTKEVGRGTGLGLAVSYGIVKDHGGSIDLETAPGKGTTFTVHLPAAQTGETERWETVS